MSMIDFLSDLTNPNLAFLARALIIAMMSSVVCAVIGTHVVLRGLSFVGDALSHAVFPGVAVAFALQGSIILGGAVAGIVVTIVIAGFSQNRKLREDSVIGVFFAAAFALGLVILSRVPGYTGSLESFLFGSLAGVSNTDILVVFISGVVILGLALLFHPYFLAVSVDRDFARTKQMRVLGIDLVLYLLIAATVVISVQSIGNILIVALLVAPAATARLITNRVGSMMLVAPAFGAAAAFFGVWSSWTFNLPAGAAVVLWASAFFIVTAIGSALVGRK